MIGLTWENATDVQLWCIIVAEPCEWIVKYQAMQELSRRDRAGLSNGRASV